MPWLDGCETAFDEIEGDRQQPFSGAQCFKIC